MTRVRTLRPVLPVLAALVAVLLSLAGCVSMPTGGPVQAHPVTQGTDAQSQQFMQIEPQSPGAGWDPQQIVEGFLVASASFGTYRNVAYQYLTPTEGARWKPNWSAVVYTNGPAAGGATYPKQPKQPKQPEVATVQVKGAVQSTLQGNGTYSVRSTKGSGTYTFHLEELNGQWRINSAPTQLLLTSVSFQHDYQLTNLYFFDPTISHLVPDPVYVPVEAQQKDLVTGLVDDLISPPGDWLLTGGATKTAFPPGTTDEDADVTLSGATAVVDLKGTAITKASNTTMAEIAAQLWNTLDGVGQDQPNGQQNGQQVESVEVERNGQPWTPPNSTDNSPVTQSSGSYAPQSGYYQANAGLYYVDSQGFLATASASGKANEIELLSGTGYTQLAVSPDGNYVAALLGDTLYTGLIGKKLTPIKGGGRYTTISWAPNNYLWATGSTGISTAYEGLGPMEGVQVDIDPGVPAPNVEYNELKVAPDGVRVAIIESGDTLTYGAISGLQTTNPLITLSTVTETLGVNQNFQSLTWYGPDDVIALATNSVLTEYPVSGAPSTPIPADSGMQTITAESTRLPLVATLDSGGSPQLVSYSSSTGSWTPVNLNDKPAKDTPFTYSG